MLSKKEAKAQLEVALANAEGAVVQLEAAIDKLDQHGSDATRHVTAAFNYLCDSSHHANLAFTAIAY